ncbi:hypothetical protein CANINC_004628 [Pichia inconspicua]|uniref:ubiquitinyl hydrolase 1 n=1 Tax=Pichia inconspicua TaxID=52247 RepID=A0A4T0WVU0_9ASCO|nr:hypothetical protein CANINC_004628 [[Candida] inconspicua]
MSVKLEKLSNNNNSNSRSRNSKSSSNTRKLNPIIDNILKDPIVFKPAKNPDKVTIKPSNYKIFKPAKSDSATEFQDLKEKKQNQQKQLKESEMARPKSLAEAMAKYTGKKYGKEATKKVLTESKKRKATTDSTDSKERLKKLLQSQNQENNYASSLTQVNTEFKERQTEHSATPTMKSGNEDPDDDDEQDDDDDDNNNNEDNDDEDDDDVDDDDFHTAESNDDHDSENSSQDEDIESSDGNNDDVNMKNMDNASTTSDDENEEREEGDEDEDEDEDDQLKKDLKGDVLTKQVQKDATETPPTSNNDDDDVSLTIAKPELITNNYSNNEFWDLNENQNNHGSNGSQRITKSWGVFIENHQSLGLVNHGVTCYMNAAVQSICHIPSLTKYLIDVNNGKHDDEIKPDSVTKVLASTVAKMFRLGHNKKIIYINPKKLCKRLADINCMMSEWQQEDSHEYFMSLMSRLQEDSTPKGVKLNQSIIYDIFGGLLTQTVTCKNCGHISTTQQEFYDLSLGLDNRKKRTSLLVEPTQLSQLMEQIKNCNSSTEKDKEQLSKILQQRILLARDGLKNNDDEFDDNDDTKGNSNTNDNHSNTTNNGKQDSQSNESSAPSRKYSLENSIRDFFTPEIIRTDKRDQSGYVCEQCKLKTNAVKISTIQRSPETLSIHLKRFRFNGQQSQKVKANVSYPEILDLTSYTTDMSTPTRYKLVSVIVHQGRSVSSGHYIAHSRQPDGSWATYDDEYVNKIPRASALSDPGAYVLFYERLTFKGLDIVEKGVKPESQKRKIDTNDRKSRSGRNKRRK